MDPTCVLANIHYPRFIKTAFTDWLDFGMVSRERGDGGVSGVEITSRVCVCACAHVCVCLSVRARVCLYVCVCGGCVCT